jgi:toxin ParE1/3/4
MVQADIFFHTFFEYFEIITQQPFSFESVDFIKNGYGRCVCGSDSIYYKINNEVVK